MADLRAVSLFSGAGGMDLGVVQAGFQVLSSVDNDPHCNNTLRAAVERESRGTSVIEADVRSIAPVDLMEDLDLRAGELDLLFGGPPCQTFSQIGKQQGLQDERGMLLFQMARFAAALRPRMILIEQVKGLLSSRGQRGRKGEVFQLLLRELETLGYAAQWRVINAADFGVPQLRKRVFIVATVPEYEFRFPAPTHVPPHEVAPLFPVREYATVGDVIADLGPPSPKGAGRADSHIDVTPPGDRSRIQGVPSGSFLAAQTHLPPEQRGRLTRKDTTKYRRLALDEPALTLRGGEIFFHPLEDRYLTPREYMRIHGFPDDYYLHGPIRSRSGRVRDLDQHRQVANAVPPPVARAIAEQIRQALLCHASSNCLDSR